MIIECSQPTADGAVAELEIATTGATPPPADEQRQAARRVLDTFDARLADAQREYQEASGKVRSHRPSETPLADLKTVGQLLACIEQVQRGDERQSDPAAVAVAGVAHRRVQEIVQGRQGAENYLRNTAPEPLRRRLDELLVRQRELVGVARRADDYDHATETVAKLKAEIERRKAEPASYTGNKPGDDNQIKFDLAAAQEVLRRLPLPVVERARAAGRELVRLVAEIKAVETEMMVA